MASAVFRLRARQRKVSQGDGGRAGGGRSGEERGEERADRVHRRIVAAPAPLRGMIPFPPR